MKPLHLYIHIPFCKSKCAYCAFYSTVASGEVIDAYLLALHQTIRTSAADLSGYRVESIYVGGGTPSLIAPHHVAKILDSISKDYRLAAKIEVSIEVNPDSANRDNLKAYINMGINRISFGLQAWQNELLSRMRRPHDLQAFLRAYTLARDVGFKNCNIDLIFGYPGQTLTQWTETLDHVLALRPQHISCYSLEVHQRTLLSKQLSTGTLSPIPEVIDRDMYGQAIQLLTQAGYQHYELSNFCLPGFECIHNFQIWQHQEYRGFGAGAHSFVDGCHFHQIDDLHAFCKQPHLITLDSTPAIEERKLEWLLLGLRLGNGFSAEDYRNEFQTDCMSDFGDQFSQLFHQGYCSYANGRIRLTMSGLNVYDAIIRFLAN